MARHFVTTHDGNDGDGSAGDTLADQPLQYTR